MGNKIKIKYPELTVRLKRMAWHDQATIWAGEPFEPIRNKHCDEMKKIITKYGWPTISKVGELASNEAWLLVQHCDHDIKFQKSCLKILKKEVGAGEVSIKNVAYLDDRVRMNSGKPQLYGTQIIRNIKNVRPYRILNPEKVDERRKRIGLTLLKDYLELIRKRSKNRIKDSKDSLCPCGSGKKYKRCHGMRKIEKDN